MIVTVSIVPVTRVVVATEACVTSDVATIVASVVRLVRMVG